jgi:glycosyltransferase involved in cell wall biosynthesis
MSIKLLELTPAYKPAYIYGGPTMSVAKLCEALANNGVDLEVLTTTANGKRELEVKPDLQQIVDGVTVTYFKRLTKDHTHFSPKLLWGLRTKIRDAKKSIIKPQPLVIHVHAWWNLVSIFSCNVAKWYGIPVILSPRGMLTNYTLGNRNSIQKAIIHSFLGQNLLKYCHIHATSEKEKQDILQQINPKSITVIPNLVDFPLQYSAISKTNDAYFNLLFLSRIEEKKGLELLFESLKGLNPNWILTIAGTGDEGYINNLKQKIDNLDLKGQIKWVGQVDNSTKFNLLAENDLTVLTSYNENFANVVIESLSVGTAVLLSDQVGLADYVIENELGWIANLTIESIQREILSAYNNSTKRVKIREEAPKIIRKDFNSETLVQKYINLYNQVI